MKKYRNIFVPAILVFTIIINSCTGPSREIFKYVPETALAVVTVHPGNLIEKGKLQELEFVKEGAYGNEFTRKLLEDPESSGIDLDTYSTFFIFGNDPILGCIIVPVKDRDDFETTINEIAEEADETITIQMHNGYSLIQHEGVTLLYDNSISITLFEMDAWADQDLLVVADKLLDLEKEERLISDKDFNNFLGKQKDINAWFSSNNIKGLPDSEDLGDAMDIFGGLKNNYGHVFADFQKGSLILSTNLRFNQTMKETIDKFNFLDKDAIKDLLNYLPSKEVVFVGNTNMDPDKIFDLLKLVNKDFNRIYDQMARDLGIDPDEIKEAYGGEFALSLNSSGKGKYENDTVHIELEKLFTFVAATRMRNEKLFEDFLSMAKEEAEITEIDGYYSINNHGFPVYIILEGKDVIVSNNEEIMKEISQEGKIVDNVTKTDFGGILTKDPIVFFLNLDKDSYESEFEDLLDREFDPDIARGYETFGQKLKSLSFSANLEEWEIRLELKDDKENSLYTLLSQIDK